MRIELSAFVCGLAGAAGAIALSEYFGLPDILGIALTILFGGLCGLLSRLLPRRFGGARNG